MSMKDMDIICRCEDLTREEIEEAIDLGFKSTEEIKRYTRAGMGPCQGRTCRLLVAQIISRKTGKNISKILPFRFRPPIKSFELGVVEREEDD
jgi:NAD(P)H-nitrite reductase large subunit